MLEAVKQNGSAVQYASEELRGDQDVGRIVLEAMKQNCLAVRLGGATTWTPRCRAGCAEAKRLGLASRFGWATWRPRCRAGGSETERMGLQHASKELRGDRDVVLEAVRRNGFLLRLALEELRGDHDVVMEAVEGERMGRGPRRMSSGTVPSSAPSRKAGNGNAPSGCSRRCTRWAPKRSKYNHVQRHHQHLLERQGFWITRSCVSPGCLPHQEFRLSRRYA